MPIAEAGPNLRASIARKSARAGLRAILFIACATAAACATPGSERQDPPEAIEPPLIVTGTLAFRNGEPPSPGSVAIVTVTDFGIAEEKTTIIAASSIQLDNVQVMIPFEVAVSKAALDSTKQYVLRGRIEDAEGEATWATGIGQLIDATAPSDVAVGVLLLVPAQNGEK